MRGGETSPGTGDDLGIIELELLKLVRRLETLGRRGTLYERVDRAGYLALRILDQLGPTSINALADALHLDASTVTRQVAVLDAAGFVRRRIDPMDRRSSIIALNAEGRRTMRQVEKERRHLLEAILGDWDVGEMGALGRVLTRLNLSLGPAADQPAGDSSG